MICGVIVCWDFRLLPRWALAVLAAREALMLVLGRYALARGVELRINWPGRLAVAPVMARCSSPWPASKGRRRCCCTSALRWR